jgi:valyl-tRNA synthetase
LVCLSRWPDLHGLTNPEADAEIGFVIDLITDIRSVRSEAMVPASLQVPLVLVRASEATTRTLQAWAPMVERLARLSALSFADVAPPQSAQIVVRGEIAAIPLEGIVDIEGEKTRLKKEIGRMEADILGIERKLGNPDFMARAPEEVVDENRERKLAAETRRTKMQEALARLI